MFESSWPQYVLILTDGTNMDARFTAIRSIALVANGAIHNLQLIAALIKKYELVVAVDGGLVYCHQMNIRPDFIMGDFDSISPELLRQYSDVSTYRFPTEKDDTDLELAIQIVNAPNVETIGLFGITGHRVDHSLNNLNILCRFPNKTVIETETETVFAIKHTKTITCYPGQQLSLLPLNTPAIGVSTTGLKWELQEATLNKDFRSISNICLGSTAEIHVKEGELLCCLGRV